MFFDLFAIAPEASLPDRARWRRDKLGFVWCIVTVVERVRAEKLRRQLAKKVKSMQARVGRAEDKVDREKSQYEQQKLQTGISMGATVLGAIFGSRGMGRATSAARGAGRIAREREDVTRAEENLQDLQEELRALEIEAEEEVRALVADMEQEEPELEEVIVRPRKSDIRVSGLKLAWKPD